MRKTVAIGVSLAMFSMGAVYLFDPLSEDVLPDAMGSSVDGSNSAQHRSPQSEEAIWQKLGDRLSGRMASSGADEPPSGSSAEGSEPVFDTRADWLAAAGVTAEEDAEARRWAFERGFETHSLGYEYYDHDTLKALADAGDMFALQRLAEHAAWGEQQFVKADVLYREAAARGSVLALDRLVYNELARASVAENKSDQPDSAKRHILTALAWADVSRRRVGDMPGPEMHEKQIRQRMKQIDMTLSEADRESIDRQAETLYQRLRETRAELGFDEFDNSVPILYEKLKRHGLENAAIRNP
ncbi:hypothetical protein OOT55_13670 [Marinimicrobium sp. C6131]|uniref:hypothetical protein n=1 Tax=Marinimicrobium sp. C6131 TaxID=3022676 RepID=UPI00223E59C1|nr:hypothetical protein [Marinimicrobium sp. C6131]UZJ43697.1 hypothetical protein OOT55_13670 [Marinimicrobium sp. C6131]